MCPILSANRANTVINVHGTTEVFVCGWTTATISGWTFLGAVKRLQRDSVGWIYVAEHPQQHPSRVCVWLSTLQVVGGSFTFPEHSSQTDDYSPLLVFRFNRATVWGEEVLRESQRGSTSYIVATLKIPPGGSRSIYLSKSFYRQEATIGDPTLVLTGAYL